MQDAPDDRLEESLLYLCKAYRALMPKVSAKETAHPGYDLHGEMQAVKAAILAIKEQLPVIAELSSELTCALAHTCDLDICADLSTGMAATPFHMDSAEQHWAYTVTPKTFTFLAEYGLCAPQGYPHGFNLILSKVITSLRHEPDPDLAQALSYWVARENGIGWLLSYTLEEQSILDESTAKIIAQLIKEAIKVGPNQAHRALTESVRNQDINRALTLLLGGCVPRSLATAIGNPGQSYTKANRQITIAKTIAQDFKFKSHHDEVRVHQKYGTLEDHLINPKGAKFAQP